MKNEAASLQDRFADLRLAYPLPPPTGQLADKAFFDELSGEDDVASEALMADGSTILADPEQEGLPLLERLAKANPLPPPTGPLADKAFFDDLSGEGPD